MEAWYKKQEYFSEEQLKRIQAWMSQDVIDIFVYNIDTKMSQFAVG